MHSWDMIKVKGSRTDNICSKKRFIERLDGFLEYSSKKYKYITIEKLIKKVN